MIYSAVLNTVRGTARGIPARIAVAATVLLAAALAVADGLLRSSTTDPARLSQLRGYELVGALAANAILVYLLTRRQSSVDRRAAQRRAAEQAALARLGRIALETDDQDRVLESAVDLVQQNLDAELVGIFEHLPETSSLLLRAGLGWSRGAVGRSELRADPDYLADFVLQSREPVLVADLREESRVHAHALFKEHDVLSAASVRLDGYTGRFGILAACAREPHRFAPKDLEFLQAVADLLAASLQNAGRRRTLHESERSHRAIVEDVLSRANIGVSVLESDGGLVWLNQTLAQYLSLPHQELLQPGRLASALEGLADDSFPPPELPAGETLELHIPAVNGQSDRWISYWWQAIERGLYAGGKIEYYGDVTERKRIEQELRALNATLEERVAERAGFVQLLQEVAVIANEAENHEQAIRHALQRVCEFMQWPIGHAYMRSEDDPDELVPTDLWHLQHPRRASKFRKLSDVTHFTKGMGLPGIVLETRQPAWIADVQSEPGLVRSEAAAENGLVTGFAIPVMVKREVGAVLELFSDRPVDPDPAVLEVLGHIGTQLGRVIERRQAEEALLESESRFRAMAHSAPDIIISANSDGRVISWSNQAAETFGYAEEQAIGMLVEQLMPERYRKAHRAGLQRLREGGKPRLLGRTIELDGLRADGTEFPMELALSSWEQGGSVFYTGILRDITERRQAEEQHRRSEAQLLEAQRIAHVGGWEWDITADVVNWTDELYRIYGLDPEQFSASYEGFLEWVHPDDRQRVREIIERAYQTAESFTFEHRVVRPDGSVRTLQARGIVETDEIGRPTRMAGTGHDVTEFKQQEQTVQSLLHISAKLSASLDLTDISDTLAQESQILVKARAACVTLRSDHEMRCERYWRGDELFELDYRWPVHNGLAEWILSHREPYCSPAENGVQAFQHELWEQFQVKQALVTPILDREGEVVGYFELHDKLDGTKFDSSDMERAVAIARIASLAIQNAQSYQRVQEAEERLRKSGDKLRRLAAYTEHTTQEERKRIAREVHDELGQLLTALKLDVAWFGRNLKGRGSENEDVLEKVRSTESLIEETIDVVRRIATELRPGVLDDLGLIPALEWQAAEFSRRTGIQCQVESDGGTIAVDPEVATAAFRTFQEALTNVARHAEATRVEVTVGVAGEELRLNIIDNGIGIPWERIHAPDSLGLLGMQERAAQLGGKLELVGREGGGTRVTLWMPLASAQPREEVLT